MAPMISSDGLRSRLRQTGGNALVEFALVLPVLLLVFGGIVDFGFLFQRFEVLSNAVREGARIAVLPQGYSHDTVIIPRVKEYIRVGLGQAAGDYTGIKSVTVTPEKLNEGTPDEYSVVTVRAQLTYTYVVIGHVASLLRAGGDSGWGTIDLHAQSTMRVEGE